MPDHARWIKMTDEQREKKREHDRKWSAKNRKKKNEYSRKWSIENQVKQTEYELKSRSKRRQIKLFFASVQAIASLTDNSKPIQDSRKQARTITTKQPIIKGEATNG